MQTSHFIVSFLFHSEELLLFQYIEKVKNFLLLTNLKISAKTSLTFLLETRVIEF